MNAHKKLILSSIAIPLLWILCLKLIFLLPLNFSEDFKWFIGGAIGSLLSLFITYQFSKLNHVSFHQIGLNWESKTPIRLLFGFLMGTAITCVLLLSIVHFTKLDISRDKDANIPLALFWMLAFVPLAFMEEVAFRGFVFFKLEKLIGLRFTLIITSVLFAYYHDVSGSTLFHQLLGPGIWGVIYGLAAIWSRGIAGPTGIHIAANVIQAVFGLKDSKYAIWVIDYRTEITDNIQSHTEMIGLFSQLFLLLFGVCTTEWYLRRKV